MFVNTGDREHSAFTGMISMSSQGCRMLELMSAAYVLAKDLTVRTKC